MRMTFSQLIQASKDAVVDDATQSFSNLSDSQTFIKREINNTVTHLFSLLKEYRLIPPSYTESTVASTRDYKFRPGFSKLESMTIDIGELVPPLRIIQSQDEWDRLIAVPMTSSYPTHVFVQRDTFSLYPTPTGVYTLRITGTFMPVNMTEADYTTATVALTSADETVTGSGTTFTSAMVNRWFAVTTGGIPYQNFYRIGTFTDTTHLELDRKVIEATASGLSYLIGQSPEIPEELHEFIPYRVAAVYAKLRRKDDSTAQELLNFFYTGDFNNSARRGNIRGGVLGVLHDLKERGRDNSQIVEMGDYPQHIDPITAQIWGTVLED